MQMGLNLKTPLATLTLAKLHFLQINILAEDKICMGKPEGRTKGSPNEKVAGSIRALPKWGGGSKCLPGWLGAPLYLG